MSGPLVIKVGGSTLGAADTSLADIAELAAGGDIPVVVHGGGAEATRWLEAMGIESHFVRGRRVTDERALPVVVAVFAGLVNKRIVAAINAAGAPACGLCGADARLLECDIAEPEFGFVGEPREVHAAVLEALRNGGIIPVIGPVGFVPGKGADTLVNVNADTVAGNIAAAVGARELVFLTDVEGVRGKAGEVIGTLTAAMARDLVADGTIAGGMIPKVEACLHAAALGVPVRVLDGRVAGALRGRDERGTVVLP